MTAEPRLIPALALVAGLLAGCGGEASGDPGARPNVLLISIDTLRADHLGVYGYPFTSMPAVEAWAERGVVFDNAYAPMAQTLPSHATMMTGLEPRVHGALENFYVLVERNVTLAEIFAEEGYETFGAIGALVLSEESGIAQGFEVWDQPDGSWDATAAHPPERTAQAVTDAALDWARARDRDRPAFAWLHYYDPHGPFSPPEGFRSSYDRPTVVQLVRDRAEEFVDVDRGREYRLAPWWGTPEAAPFDAMEPALKFVADTWWSYLREIEYTDQHLARLFEGLEAQGLLDDTVVAIVSDHGEGLFEHGEKGHGVQIWEEAVRVPWLLARTDDAFAGRRVEAPAVMADLAPTILAAASVDPAVWRPLMEGVDHWELLEAGRGAPVRPVFVERPHFSRERMTKRNGLTGRHRYGILAGIVDGETKLVRESNAPMTKVRSRFLVDLADDPGEWYDLSEVRPELLEDLSAKLDAWLGEYPTEPPGTQADLSDERIKQLEALGYLK